MTHPEAGWYADSHNPALLRWWDGNAWTDHTREAPGRPQPAQGPASRVGSGPLYGVPELLVIEQPVSSNQLGFRLVDANAQVLGSVQELAPLAAGDDPRSERRYQLLDAAGTPLLHVTQPFKTGGEIFKPRFSITDARGAPIGEIKSETAGLGKNRVAFLVNNEPIGGFKATSWLSSKYQVTDAGKNQVAEIVKREFDEMPLPHIPADGESYLLRRPQQLPEPLGSLVLFAPVALDIAYHDDSTV